jgi:hypothetical protein
MRDFAALRKHFQTADLRNALARGFRSDDRLRALIHFDGECPLCGASLGAALADRGSEAGHEAASRRLGDLAGLRRHLAEAGALAELHGFAEAMGR